MFIDPVARGGGQNSGVRIGSIFERDTGSQQKMNIGDRSFNWGERTYIMGVLNVTPDSFSDGGKFATVDAALAQAIEMVAAGADIIDIGGESAKPGAMPVDAATELSRVIGAIESLRQHPVTQNIPISIDTTKAIVAERAIAAGANMVNDISGGVGDPQILEVVARAGVPYILMHMRGQPDTMQQLTDYADDDVVAEIYRFCEGQINKAAALGIDRQQIILDPGIGFAKTVEQNIQILQQLDRLRPLQAPLLIGVSRKSFIGKILDRPDPLDRLWGTAAACCHAISSGADILRVHDVAEMVDVCRVADKLWRSA
jgi:dihydropteroate synthase